MKPYQKTYYIKRYNFNFFFGECVSKVSLNTFPILFMILVTFSACSNHSSNNKTLETKITQGIRIGLFLPMYHDNQTIKSVAKNYYNAAKLAADAVETAKIQHNAV